MSQLAHLQEKLHTVGATMGRLEMELARHPAAGLVANMRSLRKLHDTLQEDFAYAANQVGLDVLHYRLLEERPTAKALSSSVGTFQEAVTVAYDAVRSGVPKNRRVYSTIVEAETALQIAYSYPGSFGVVFTVPTERMLIPDVPSQLDRAMQTVLKLGKAYEDRQMISEVERRFGKATLRAVYSWATANARSRTGTAIEWRRSDTVRADVLIQEPEFRALSETLDKLSGKETRPLKPTGWLVGADIKTRRFHFVTSGDEDIRGNFTDAISESQVAQIPRRYTAIIQATTETSYATDEEIVTYFLERLEPL